MVYLRSRKLKTQVTLTTSQGGVVDYFFYDRELRLVRHVDPNNNTSEFRNEDYARNALDQNVLEKTIINPVGNQKIEIYDALNRVIERRQLVPDNTIVSQEWLLFDKKGN